MIGRASAALAALVGLSGCCHLPQQPETSELCAFESAGAKAWVNRMPGPARAGRKMQVYIEIEPDDIARSLVRLDDKDTRLQLEVREWDDGEPLPHIAWRMSAPANLPAGIDIHCNGEMILSVDDIQTVS